MHPLDTLEQRTSTFKKEKADELDLNVWLIYIYNNRWSREKLKLEFQIRVPILCHVSEFMWGLHYNSIVQSESEIGGQFYCTHVQSNYYHYNFFFFEVKDRSVINKSKLIQCIFPVQATWKQGYFFFFWGKR